jgi:hypothetical protein
MGLERHGALGAGEADEEVEQAEQVDVVGLLKAAPLNTLPKPWSVCFTSCMEFDIRKAPVAAPPIAQTSKGRAVMMMPNLPPWTT